MKRIILQCLELVLMAGLMESLNITDFGAIKNNGSFEASLVNGAALSRALHEANTGLDRTVYIDDTYTMLPTGAINNLTDVTIQLDGGIIAWDGDENMWPNRQTGCDALSLISLAYSDGVVIRGNGIIEGNGWNWWISVIETGYDNRPGSLIDISKSKNLLIDGITMRNAPQYHLNLNDVLNVTVKNIVIHVDLTRNHSAPTFPLNTDGIDISGKDIYFTNLTIQNYDDAVAVKPTHKKSAIYSECTENLLIENSYVKYGVGMTIGSVPPNENENCIRNVTFRNIKFDNPLKAIYIKPNPGDSGTGLITDILYENITINNAIWWAIYIGTQQQHQPHQEGTGTKCDTNPRVTVQNIHLKNIDINGGVLSPGVLICNATNPCTNFIFDNVNVHDRSYFPVAEGYYCQNIKGHAINSNLIYTCFANSTDLNVKKSP